MRERICNNCGGKQYKLVGQNMVKCCFCGSLYVNEEASKEEEVLEVGVREKLRALDFQEALQEANNLLMLFPYSFDGYFLKALAKNKVMLYRNKMGTKTYPICFESEIPLLSQDAHFKRSIELSPEDIAQERLEIAKQLEELKYARNLDKTQYDVIFAYVGSDDVVLHAKDNLLQLCKEKGLNVFEFSDKFNSYGAQLCRAIETAKACVMFAGKENLFSDASRKMLIDGYRLQMLEQKKSRSSLILVCRKSVLDMTKIPDELTVEKSIIDLDEQSYVDDFFALLSKEMKRTATESVKLEKTEIVDVTPTKKEYVDIDPVQTTELGHYAVENVEPNQENRLKWIFLMLKNQDFESAKEVVSEELEKTPNDAHLLFAELLIDNRIETKAKFFESIQHFEDKEKIEKILKYADKNFAEEFVDNWENLLIKLNSTEFFNRYLLYLAKFNTPNRETFVNAAANKAIERQNLELIEKVEKCFDPQDVDRFVEFYFSLAQKSDDANFYEKILQLDVGHEESNYFVLLQHFKTHEDILTYREKEEVEKIFQYLKPEARAKLVEFIINLILPIAYKNLAQAQEQIDFYLAYLSEEQILPLLKKIFEQFRDMGFFKAAEKYAVLAISLEKTNASLYWELIKTKTHCKTDQDVVLSKISFAKLPEWQTLLSLASEEEAEKCARIVSKSNLYRGEKKELAHDLCDAIELKEKINEFLLRNQKILQEFESQYAETAGRGVQYYKLQLKPFEKALTQLDEANDFEEYCDVVRKVDMRLAAMNLNLESSIKLSATEEKNQALKGIVESPQEVKKNLEKAASHEKNIGAAKRFAYWFLCVVPLSLTALLLVLLIAIPKDVYMHFTQNFLIVMTIYSAAVAIGFLCHYIKVKKTAKTKVKITNIFVIVLGLLNGLLFAVGMVFIPRTISIENEKEFAVLVKNAGNSSLSIECDLDMSSARWQGGDFYGKLDGNGFTISNLTFKDVKVVGLFRSNSGTIKNLNLSLSKETYEKVEKFGAFACVNRGTIEKCALSGKIAVETKNDLLFGGFVAEQTGGKLSSCQTTLEASLLTSGENVVVGGLVAQVLSQSSNIEISKNSNFSTLKIQNLDAEELYLGGLVGSLEKIDTEKIQICQNANEISLIVEGNAKNVYVGGLAGVAKSQLTNNYVDGMIAVNLQQGNGYVGGLVGEFVNLGYDGKISYCYSIAQIEATETLKVGLLVGNLGGSINNSFSTGDGVLIGESFPYAKAEKCFTLGNFYNRELDFDEDIWVTSQFHYPKFVWQE